MTNNFFKRLTLLRKQLQLQNLSGMVVSKRTNIHYLTGLNQLHPVNREALLFITDNDALLYHSSFLTPPSHPFLNHVVMHQPNSLAQAMSIFSSGDKVAFEGDNLTVNELETVKQKNSRPTYITTTGIIESIQVHKDSSERKLISKACQITANVMKRTIQFVHQSDSVGITEKALAQQIERDLVDSGATGLAFPIIVAFDKNSALPHHIPGSSQLTSTSIVLLDFGGELNGYASDMTRTIKKYGEDTTFSVIEKVVKKAYRAARDCILLHHSLTELTKQPTKRLTSSHSKSSPSLMASAIDNAARTVIEDAGFGKYFIHTTGHGLGLEIHEKTFPQSTKPGFDHANDDPYPGTGNLSTRKIWFSVRKHSCISIVAYLIKYVHETKS
jgi:Xaa-Pro aminopeptidase